MFNRLGPLWVEFAPPMLPALKLDLASDPSMEIDTYIARKSAVLQKILALSDLTSDERSQILKLNDPQA
jgi:hypothetical protein